MAAANTSKEFVCFGPSEKLVRVAATIEGSLFPAGIVYTLWYVNLRKKWVHSMLIIYLSTFITTTTTASSVS